MDTDISTASAFAPMLAAYKMRLYKAAERLGGPPETWGDADAPIDPDYELSVLEGQGEFRLAPYPFPGLRSFSPDEGDLFFGRAQSVEAVRLRLEKQRVVVVCGGSGSGKSSLVRAGLLPFLNTRHRVGGRAGNWYFAEFRPRTDPILALSECIADGLLLPFAALRVTGLREALGLEAGVDQEGARSILRARLQKRFETAKEAGRKELLQTLLDITGPELDQLDRIATRGLRLPGPSFLLLLDQFEEVFRPEVASDGRAALLDLIVDVHTRLNAGDVASGLFLTITIRSEELHRCAEHRSLSNVVNSSLFLLELLDPADPADAADLRQAIIQPARHVFEDWGIDLDPSNPDSPFSKGVPDWLLDGARALSAEIEHRPDQLPLLQHALQAVWHAAMRAWGNALAGSERLEIRKEHLPGFTDNAATPDLAGTLRKRADRAVDRAASQAAAELPADEAAGRAVLRAAFRALARSDDRGNWARRFAKSEDMSGFLATEPELAAFDADRRWAAACRALQVFVLRGYVSGDDHLPYDISHEALIRNWPQFQEWLREPREVAYALSRIMEEVDPAKFPGLNEAARIAVIPDDVSQRIRQVAPGGALPAEWGADQIAPRLTQPSMRERWGTDKMLALQRLADLSLQADAAREAAAARVKADEIARIADQNLADLRRWRLKASAVTLVVVLLIGATAFVWNYRRDKDAIRQLSAHGLIGAMQSENENQPWPLGTRERAALLGRALLDGGPGQSPSPEKLKVMADERWDNGVRTILGARYIVQEEIGPAPADQGLCMTLGMAGTTAKSAQLMFRPPGSQTLIRLATILGTGDRWAIQMKNGSDWQNVPSGLGASQEPGSRLCLAPDATLLTQSSPGRSQPGLFELHWACKAAEGMCTSGQGFEVSGRQISVVNNWAGPRGSSIFPCVRAIQTGEMAGPSVTKVLFSAETDANQCEKPPSGTLYRAEYVTRLAFPLLANLPAVDVASMFPCKIIPVQGRSGERPMVRECKLGASGAPITLTLTPSDKGWQRLELNRLHVAMPIYSATIQDAGLDRKGNLVLRDASKLTWQLVLNKKTIEAVLNERACFENTCAYPDDLRIIMDDRELARKKK